jgi:hypothetical protein
LSPLPENKATDQRTIQQLALTRVHAVRPTYRATISIDAVPFVRCPCASLAQIGMIFTPGAMSAGTRTAKSNVLGGAPQAGQIEIEASAGPPNMLRSA